MHSLCVGKLSRVWYPLRVTQLLKSVWAHLWAPGSYLRLASSEDFEASCIQLVHHNANVALDVVSRVVQVHASDVSLYAHGRALFMAAWLPQVMPGKVCQAAK